MIFWSVGLIGMAKRRFWNARYSKFSLDFSWLVSARVGLKCM